MPSLSIAIPVYNFAGFLPETLDTIAAQPEAQEVEVVILDGGSTDSTPDVVESYRAKLPRLNYARMPAKGGIDRDMARSVEHSSGDYVWLFSGDDLMHAGSIRRVLDEIRSGHDLYLCKHMEWLKENRWAEWPVLDLKADEIFDFNVPGVRARYFGLAANTEAFFSFIGGLIVKRATWNRVPFNADFDGSCWAHSARLMELMKQGMVLKYLSTPLLDRRPDNDSFMGRGIVWRFALSIDGFNKIADTFFGHDSVEARNIRRVVRGEFPVWQLLMGKYACAVAPDREDTATMSRLVSTVYGDFDWACLKARWTYATTPPRTFRKWNPDIAAGLEKRYGRPSPV
jgi:abequosyltransferase